LLDQDDAMLEEWLLQEVLERLQFPTHGRASSPLTTSLDRVGGLAGSPPSRPTPIGVRRTDSPLARSALPQTPAAADLISGTQRRPAPTHQTTVKIALWSDRCPAPSGGGDCEGPEATTILHAVPAAGRCGWRSYAWATAVSRSLVIT